MRTFITLSIFIIIAIASYWLLHDITEETNEAQKANTHFPDYFLENFSTTSMDIQGNPVRTLHAKKMLHFADNNSAELEQPVINIRYDNTQINLSASRGTLLQKENIIYLEDNVIVHQAAAAGKSELYIYTDYLKVNTQSQIMETHLAAKIKTDDGQINTTGLIFNKLQGTLKFLSNVKGIYEPAR